MYQSLVSKRIEAGEDPYPITFCERVPNKVYEMEKKTGAETALAGLILSLAGLILSFFPLKLFLVPSVGLFSDHIYGLYFLMQCML